MTQKSTERDGSAQETAEEEPTPGLYDLPPIQVVFSFSPGFVSFCGHIFISYHLLFTIISSSLYYFISSHNHNFLTITSSFLHIHIPLYNHVFSSQSHLPLFTNRSSSLHKYIFLSSQVHLPLSLFTSFLTSSVLLSLSDLFVDIFLDSFSDKIFLTTSSHHRMGEETGRKSSDCQLRRLLRRRKSSRCLLAEALASAIFQSSVIEKVLCHLLNMLIGCLSDCQNR